MQSEVGFSHFLVQASLLGKFHQGWTVTYSTGCDSPLIGIFEDETSNRTPLFAWCEQILVH